MFDPKPVKIDTDQIRLLIGSYLVHLRKKAGIILLIVVLGMVASFAWNLTTSPIYQAKCTFVLEEKSSGGGGIAGLASQFGFDLGSLGGGSGNFFSGDNINDIISSSTVMDEVLLSKSDSTTTLADLYLNASGMRMAYGWKDKLNGFSFAKKHTNDEDHTLRDTALLVIREKILEKSLLIDKANKKGSIFGLQVKSSDPVFAKLFTERLVSVTSNMYIDIKTRNLTGNIAKLEKRADSLRQLFGSKSRQSYSQQILDANEAFKMNLANTEISQRDKSVIFEIYAEVMKNLEVSRMLLINQMPVIQVLDRPKDPLVDVRMPLFKLLTIAFLLSIVIGILLATFSFRMPQGNGE